jgi:hypothetical protein
MAILGSNAARRPNFEKPDGLERNEAVATKRQSTRKIKNLKVKNIPAAKAKRVKGGPISHPGEPRETGVTSLLVPAVQKVRE